MMKALPARPVYQVKLKSQLNAKAVTLVKSQTVTASPVSLAQQANLWKLVQLAKTVLILEKFQQWIDLAVWPANLMR